MLKSSDVDGLEGELGEGEAPAGTFGAAPVPASTAPPAASDKVDVLAEQEQRLRALARGLFRRLVLGEAGALAPYLAVEAQLRQTAAARAASSKGGTREEWEEERRAEAEEAARRVEEKLGIVARERRADLARKLGTAAGKTPAEMTNAELMHAREVLTEHLGGARAPTIYLPPEGDE